MANISINSTPTRVQYVATAAQTTFTYAFPIKESTDLKVYKRAAADAPNDTTDLLTLTTDYTVTGANTESGGTVVLVAGADAGDIVTIMGDKPVDRNAIYDQSVTLKKSDLNNDFNDNVMYDKQARTEIDQLGIKYHRSEQISPTFRQDNLKFPILNQNEIPIGRGDAGDTPDDISTILVTAIDGIALKTLDYVIGTADPIFPDAQVLGDLTTGLLKNTTVGATGTVSIAAQGTDYYAPGGTDVAIVDGGTGASTALDALGNLISGTAVPTATVASADKVIIQDASDADNIKSVTAQDIADLGAGGTVDSVSGTADRITSTGGNDPVLDIAATYVGQTSITTLGTVATGTWEATDIGVTHGGTGASTAADARTNLDTQQTLSGLTITAATVASTDKVLVQDTDDADNLKTVTAQAIADLGAGGTVDSVSGTTDRITSTGGTDPVLDIAAAYVGQTSLTTLGTIATGTWEATDVGVAHGGTGASTAANARTNLSAQEELSGLTITAATVAGTDKVLIQDTDDTDNLKTVTAQDIADLGATGTVTSVSGTADRITSTGGTTPTLDIAATYVGQTSLTTLGTVATGTWEATDIGVAHGGTGLSTATEYAVLCGGTTATGAFQSIASVGTANQILTSNGAGALPTFQDAPATGVTSVSGTAGRVTSTGGSDPVLDIDAGYVGQGSITTLGTIGTGTWNASQIDVSFGGTGVTSLTEYALVCGGTTTTDPVQQVPGTGTANQVLTSNGPGTLPTFQDAAGGSGITQAQATAITLIFGR